VDTETIFHAQLAAEFSLAGRVAVVTGAGSGIGRETAHVLAQAGAKVVLADVNAAGLEETCGLIAGDGGAALVQPTDVTRRAEVEALAQAALAHFGRLDIWVNCAGIIVNVPIVEASEEQIDRMLAVNLKGVYAGCAVAGRVMKAAGSGVIINLSSGGGESAVPGLSIYSMTKAAVNMLTKTAAKELGPHGIRANAIAPGWVDTPMGLHGFRDEAGVVSPERRAEALKSRATASPLGITGTPRDIALAALYLASDAARFVTGQIIRPNGGVAMP
jgi:3-oxoacyl-[acyl-carrier protein] reductase